MNQDTQDRINECLEVARDCDEQVRDTARKLDQITIGYLILISVYSVAIGCLAKDNLWLLLMLGINGHMYLNAHSCYRDRNSLIAAFLEIRQKALSKADELKKEF